MAAKNKMADHLKAGPDFFSLASLDRFGMNKIFFYGSFLYKMVLASHSKPGLLCPGFEWSGYLMIETGIGTGVMYSDPPNTGPSGFRMVIFRTLLKSGFQMVKGTHLVFTIPKPDKKSGFRMVWRPFCI